MIPIHTRTSITPHIVVDHLAAADALLGIDPSLIRVWRRRLEFAAETPVAARVVDGESAASATGTVPPITPTASVDRPVSRARGEPPSDVEERRVPSIASAPKDTVATRAELPPAMPASHGDRTDSAARRARLDALRAEHDASCPHCTTATAHTQTVFGEGSPVAEVMFVGEAPGETEDRLGRPFVGRAGEKLDQIITAMGLARSDVYIANVLKSRPPDNRTPLRAEIEGCGPYLRRQIEIIQPRAIVTLGGPATQLLLGVDVGITRLRGIWASYAVGDREVPVMPTFHPAYLLRNYTPETRRQVWEDMQKVLQLLTPPR